MSKKTMGIIACAVGIVLLAVSLLADTIGIGGSAGFGTFQILGAVAGVVIAAVGVYLIVKK